MLRSRPLDEALKSLTKLDTMLAVVLKDEGDRFPFLGAALSQQHGLYTALLASYSSAREGYISARAHALYSGLCCGCHTRFFLETCTAAENSPPKTPRLITTSLFLLLSPVRAIMAIVHQTLLNLTFAFHPLA